MGFHAASGKLQWSGRIGKDLNRSCLPRPLPGSHGGTQQAATGSTGFKMLHGECANIPAEDWIIHTRNCQFDFASQNSLYRIFWWHFLRTFDQNPAAVPNMPDLHSLPDGWLPGSDLLRSNGPDHLVLERFKLRELAEGWPCYRCVDMLPTKSLTSSY